MTAQTPTLTNMKVEIELREFSYKCADGCCLSYGTTTVVNGKELPFINQDVETILIGVLEELGYEVELKTYYNEEQT